MTNSHHHYFTHYHLSLPKFNPLLPESTLQTTARGPPSFKDSPCIFGANDIRGFWGGSETLLVLVLFMTQLLLLGKFEYTGGPIFKVVLEC